MTSERFRKKKTGEKNPTTNAYLTRSKPTQEKFLFEQKQRQNAKENIRTSQYK